jgi:hypothetical protein
MYRAKRHHIYLRGSQTDVMILTRGRIHEVNRFDMEDAEKLGPEIDNTLKCYFMGLIGELKYPPDQRLFSRYGLRYVNVLACTD